MPAQVQVLMALAGSVLGGSPIGLLLALTKASGTPSGGTPIGLLLTLTKA